MSRRSGTLKLATPAQNGEIVFRLGKVVASFRSDASESIGEAIMRAGVMSPTTFQEMLGAQAAGQVGPALFDTFKLRGEALDAVLEEYLKRQIYDMFEWKDGTFSFVLDEQPEPWDGFALDKGRAVSDRGLNPQYLAIEGARLRDEHGKEDALETFVALTAPPPDAAAAIVSSEALARSLQPESKPPEGKAPQPGGPTMQQDEDWSQVHLEGAAPLLPEPRVAPVAAQPASDELKVIQFPQGGRAGRPVVAAAPTAPAASWGGQAEPARAALQEEPAQEPAMVAEAPLQPEAVPAGVAGTATLLVIDDDVQVLHHVRAAMQLRVMQVVTVSSVIEALRILETPPPDLVVASDLILARSDGGGILGGIEILECVRARSPNMPVILFSDYQNEEADARARALNVTLQLVKPRKAQIYADGNRGAATPPMRDFLVRLEAALAPYLAPPEARPAAPAAPPITYAPPPPPAAAPVPRGEVFPATLGDATYDLRNELAAALDASGLGNMELPPLTAASVEMSELRSMVAEMRDPANNESVSLLILRYASAVFERGALFLPTRRMYVGLGGFSVSEDSERFVHRVRQLQVPVEFDSLFTQVVQYRTMIRAPLADVEGNRCLIDGLGGGWHSGDAVAVPLISGERVAAILFGDNPSGKPIAPTDGLEIFLQQAGLMMERALLERKLEDSRRKR